MSVTFASGFLNSPTFFCYALQQASIERTDLQQPPVRDAEAGLDFVQLGQPWHSAVSLLAEEEKLQDFGSACCEALLALRTGAAGP